jgi:hypothetical protein
LDLMTKTSDSTMEPQGTVAAVEMPPLCGNSSRNFECLPRPHGN